MGNFASYCRCVGSQKISNGKRKGSGNTKNGNKYLSWAFVEAANFAIRFSPKVRSFYQTKESQEPPSGGDQSGGAQAVSGLLLHYEGSGALRYEKSFQRKVSFYGWDGTASSYRGWLTTMRFDWPLSHP